MNYSEISSLTLITILSVILLILWYMNLNNKFWYKMGIKGPKPVLFFGNILKLMLNPSPLVELEWINKFGKIYGIYIGRRPILTVADPQLIKTVLVKDFHLFSNRKSKPVSHEILNKNLFRSRGEDWKRLRSIVSPTFTSGKLKKMYPMIRVCIQEFLDHLEPFASDRKDVNLKDIFGNLTMDVIASCAFATKTNSHKDPNDPFVSTAKKLADFNIYTVIAAAAFPKFLNKLLNVKNTTNEKHNQYFINLTRHILKNRRIDDKKHNDFLQLLVDAEKDSEDIEDENDVNEAHHVNQGKEESQVEKEILNIRVKNKKLTENEILAQAFIFFFAGYETTATTLSFCSYELAVNTECQEKLYEEVKTAVDSNGEINYETLAKLPYLDAVLSETLRKYPPLLRLEREVSTDYELGNTGIKLLKGQIIEIPVYGIHHSEEYYPNPEQFIPERFLPENRNQITPYTYLPFGSGPRNCIGMRFALLESKLALLQTIIRYKFFRSGATEVPLKFRRSFFCSARINVVGIEKRD